MNCTSPDCPSLLERHPSAIVVEWEKGDLFIDGTQQICNLSEKNDLVFFPSIQVTVAELDGELWYSNEGSNTGSHMENAAVQGHPGMLGGDKVSNRAYHKHTHAQTHTPNLQQDHSQSPAGTEGPVSLTG